MVHNGIEYGDMQLICEAYQLMKEGLGLDHDRMHADLRRVERGRARLLPDRDHPRHPRLPATRTASRCVEKILDTAGQKGTGKWTAMSALEMGIPLTLIGEAVFARCLSALKDERVAADKVLDGPGRRPSAATATTFVDDLRQALYASKIVSYAQGYMLMRAAAEEYGWNLNNGGIALMWRGGCIIRSAFLGKIKEAFDSDPELDQPAARPLLHGRRSRTPRRRGGGWWRRRSSWASRCRRCRSALAFYDGYRRERLPANLLQAQRDYFGAHTYERVDRPRGEFFHTDWTGHGGDVTARTYQA